MKRIFIKKRDGTIRYAIVDDDMYHLVSSLNWNLTAKGYARCTMKGLPPFFMHNLIAGKPLNGLQVDHINQNKLDNRRGNLRIVNQSINKLNSPHYRTNKSGCPGVSWNRRMRRWVARIGASGKPGLRGTYRTFEEAKSARRQFERQLKGTAYAIH